MDHHHYHYHTFPSWLQLLEPYQSTELRTHQLRRIHAANDLLKKVSRFSATLARLRKGPLQGLELDLTTGVGAASGAALAGLDTRELAQAAAHLHELEGLVQVRACWWASGRRAFCQCCCFSFRLGFFFFFKICK